MQQWCCAFFGLLLGPRALVQRLLAQKQHQGGTVAAFARAYSIVQELGGFT